METEIDIFSEQLDDIRYQNFLLSPLMRGNCLPQRVTLKMLCRAYKDSSIAAAIFDFVKAKGIYTLVNKETLVLPQTQKRPPAFFPPKSKKQEDAGYRLWLDSSELAMRGGNRNMDGVIAASALIGRATTYKRLRAQLANILKEGNFSQVVELGSGEGEIISSILAENLTVRGIAVDKEASAAESAATTAKRYGVKNRLKLITADINQLNWETLATDGNSIIVCASFVLHDFSDISEDMGRLAISLPPGSKFIIADLVSDKDSLVHSFGLSIIAWHYQQGITIPSVSEWTRIFLSAGLEIDNISSEGMMPGACLFQLTKAHVKNDHDPASTLVHPVQKRFPGHHESVPSLNFGDQVETVILDMSRFPNGISDEHCHAVDEFIMTTGGVIELFINGKRLEEVKGPAGIRVPAGTSHYWRPVSVAAGDYIIGQFIGGQHE